MMTTDTIREAAIAAFRTRYRDRPWVTWESQPAPVQIRWEQAAARVLNGNDTTGHDLRAFYITGMSAKSWTELGLDQRRLWNDAVTAIQRVAMEARAAA